jgi:hypothetical protein
VGVTWELVGPRGWLGLTMGQVAVKWNTTGEWRAFIGAGVGEEGDMGRSGQIGGGHHGGKQGVLMWFSWWCAQMATCFALVGEARGPNDMIPPRGVERRAPQRSGACGCARRGVGGERPAGCACRRSPVGRVEVFAEAVNTRISQKILHRRAFNDRRLGNNALQHATPRRGSAGMPSNRSGCLPLMG